MAECFVGHVDDHSDHKHGGPNPHGASGASIQKISLTALSGVLLIVL